MARFNQWTQLLKASISSNLLANNRILLKKKCFQLLNMAIGSEGLAIT